MNNLLMLGTLWLACTAGGVAVAREVAPPAAWLAAPESLSYDVRWGPINLGEAQLRYAPQGAKAYALEAHVEDDSLFLDLNDTWRAEGVLTAQGWQSRTYTAVQKENSYRADKVVTFKPGKAVYENRIGREPVQEFDLPPGTRDVLSTLYTLRALGLEGLQQPRTVPVMGLKRVGALTLKPAVLAPGTHAAEGKPVWMVEMLFDGKDPKKPRVDRWRIWLADDGKLTPLRIEAKVKLGTFVAVLDQRF